MVVQIKMIIKHPWCIIKIMIGYIKGKIISKDTNSIVVDTGGVGYEVHVSERFLSEVSSDEVELFIWTHLKQDALELYGCATRNEMDLLKMLTKMSGVGPKLALALSHFETPFALKNEIESRGSKLSKETRGLGIKKLKMILLELTGKVKEISKDDLKIEQLEAIEGLRSLGFSAKDARDVVIKIDPSITDPKEMIEEALKNIGKK